MAKDVCCKVDTCVYNSHDKCHADEIMIDTCNCHNAKDTKETACDTFKLK